MYISGVRAAKLLAYNLVIKCISVILAFFLQICYLDELLDAILFGKKCYRPVIRNQNT